MQFCPKCDNIMDIGKTAPRTLAQTTPNTVSSDTSIQNDYIVKLINMWKDKQDISNIRVDIKQLNDSSEFKKLKESDRNQIIKLLTTEIDDTMAAYRICKNCSYFERLTERTLVLSRMNTDSVTSGTGDLVQYKYIIHDQTLPHTRDYICKNKNCESHKNFEKRDAKWFRPNPSSYAVIYGCTSCGYLWKI
jgi:DNA-directed RNA polymerase subunit M/transcription elongation factor TFIIS